MGLININIEKGGINLLIRIGIEKGGINLPIRKEFDSNSDNE